MNKLFSHPLGRALLTVLYIGGVVLFVGNMETIVGAEESLWFPVLALTLLVLSAATTGALVLGRPIMLYLEGKKGEAIRFFAQTLGWLFGLLVVLVGIILVLRPW